MRPIAYSGSLLADFGRIVIKPTPFICTKVVPPRSHTGSHALKNTYFVTGYKDSSVTINPRSNSDGVILFGGESTAQDELEKYIEEHAPSGEINDSLGNFKPIIEGIQDFARGVLAEWEDEGVVGAGHADYNWSGIMGMVSQTHLTPSFNVQRPINLPPERRWYAIRRRGPWKERPVDFSRLQWSRHG